MTNKRTKKKITKTKTVYFKAAVGARVFSALVSAVGHHDTRAVIAAFLARWAAAAGGGRDTPSVRALLLHVAARRVYMSTVNRILIEYTGIQGLPVYDMFSVA